MIFSGSSHSAPVTPLGGCPVLSFQCVTHVKENTVSEIIKVIYKQKLVSRMTKREREKWRSGPELSVVERSRWFVVCCLSTFGADERVKGGFSQSEEPLPDT